MDAWVIGGLAVFGVALTLLTSWLVSRLWGGSRRAASVTGLLAQLLWAVLLVAAGWLTIRYSERLRYPVLGYAIGVIVMAALSVTRAVLFQRGEGRPRKHLRLPWRELAGRALHDLLYVLTAITACLLVSILIRARIDPLLFIPLAIGALLPGLGSRDSLAGFLVQQPVDQSHRSVSLRAIEWRSLGAAALVAIVALPVVLLGGMLAWAMIPLGYVCHLLVDMARPGGLLLFWPLLRKRVEILGGIIGPAEGPAERRLTLVLGIMVLVALLVADVGPSRPPAVFQPTYDQTLDRYYGLRGRRLVYADLDGSWQASGRRLRGRFEVLNASGQSYVLLDRYSGRVFTGGREAADHLYLDSITLVPGAEARVKPVELPLAGDGLDSVLQIIYEMQREPGLQHIFVSGDLVLAPEEQGVLLKLLASEYSQTEVRRFERLDDRHYRLNFVPASQVIPLASLKVEEGGLLIVATYQNPPSGPTVTPLPSPAVMSGGPASVRAADAAPQTLAPAVASSD